MKVGLNMTGGCCCWLSWSNGCWEWRPLGMAALNLLWMVTFIPPCKHPGCCASGHVLTFQWLADFANHWQQFLPKFQLTQKWEIVLNFVEECYFGAPSPRRPVRPHKPHNLKSWVGERKDLGSVIRSDRVHIIYV